MSIIEEAKAFPIVQLAESIHGLQMERRGGEYAALCPFHADTNASCTFSPEKNLFNCFGCGAGGSPIDYVIAAGLAADAKTAAVYIVHTYGLGGGDVELAGNKKPASVPAKDYSKMDNAALAKEAEKLRDMPEGKAKALRDELKKHWDTSLTLARYAADKKLPLEFLRDLGLADGRGVVIIPYRLEDGSPGQKKKRLNGNKDLGVSGFLWPGGVPLCLYGLDRLKDYPDDRLILVEGESDSQTLWLHGYPALGVPGADGFKPEWSGYLSRFKQVYLHREPDEGGARFIKKTATALKGKYKGQVLVFSIDGHKDPSDLHIACAEGEFEVAIEAAMAGAEEPEADAGGQEIDVKAVDAHCTDMGNAQRLAARHGENIHHCWPLGKFFVWDGSAWTPDDTGRIATLAKDTARAIHNEVAACIDPDYMKKLSSWAFQSESESRLKAMVSLSRSEPGIPVLPRELDADPMLLNLPNGTLDLRQDVFLFREHRKADLITKTAPVAFDKTAKCPMWDAFLDRIMDGNQAVIEYLQKCCGLSLTGDTSEHVLLVMHGGGANGKSTFQEVMLRLLGGYAKAAAPGLLLASKYDRHPTELADLMGVRALFSYETEEGRRLAEATVKQLTGGDRIKARKMRQDFFEFDPTHKIWLATNHKPIIRGNDAGIWRRIKLIPFAVTIPDKEKIPHYAEKLIAELPGILNWAIRGCLAWQRDGLREPQEIVSATGIYREEMDPIQAFIDEMCVVKAFAQIRSSELYGAFSEWCKRTGEWEIPQRQFSMVMKDRGYETRHGETGTFFVGLGLQFSPDGNSGNNREFSLPESDR